MVDKQENQTRPNQTNYVRMDEPKCCVENIRDMKKRFNNPKKNKFGMLMMLL